MAFQHEPIVMHGRSRLENNEFEANLIPRKTVEEAMSAIFDKCTFSESQTKYSWNALLESGFRMVPSGTGEGFVLMSLESHRGGYETSILEELEEDSTCEELLENVPRAQVVRGVDEESEYVLSRRRRASTGIVKSTTTVSYTPGPNLLGTLNIFSYSPHTVELLMCATLDTASDFNLLSAERYRELKVDRQLLVPHRQNVITSSGAAIAHQRAKVSFVVHGWPFKYTAWFFILECMDNTDAILGHKFINKFRFWPDNGVLTEVLAAQAAAAEDCGYDDYSQS